uniref:Uncharacterized protein n=1 Tax=Arundo donax TaxID=35708 RepID=A0A0A9F6P6_ARUDO
MVSRPLPPIFLIASAYPTSSALSSQLC